MPTLGFIGEGVTDLAVVENILLGYFQGEEAELRQVQPPEKPPGAKDWTWERRFSVWKRASMWEESKVPELPVSRGCASTSSKTT